MPRAFLISRNKKIEMSENIEQVSNLLEKDNESITISNNNKISTQLYEDKSDLEGEEDDDDETRLQINEDDMDEEDIDNNDEQIDQISTSYNSSSISTTSTSSTTSSMSLTTHVVEPFDHLYNLTQLAEVSLAYFNHTLPNTISRKTVICNTKDVNIPSTTESFECRDCGKHYSTSSNLARHRQIHRSPDDTKARTCPQCGKLYVSMPAYSMHLRTHNQICQCPHCSKCFSRPWLLQGHIRTHTGEKPFKCKICEKAFADKSNLRAHIQTHSKIKPFICEKCGKAFALKSYLYKHEESSCLKSNITFNINNNNNNSQINKYTIVV